MELSCAGLLRRENRFYILFYSQVQWKLRADLGLFSEPWTVEISGVQLHLQTGLGSDAAAAAAAAAAVAAAEAAEADDTHDYNGSKTSPNKESKESGDWVPLHRAVENMRLAVVGMHVAIRGPPGALLELTWDRLELR